MSYSIVALKSVLDEFGESFAKAKLSDFSCPQNIDVQDFLLKKAIIFEQKKLSRTHLVFDQFKGTNRIVGYFTLTVKIFDIPASALNTKFKDRLNRFSESKNGLYHVSCALIAQLGKNFTDGLDKLITGDELLQFAIGSITKPLRNNIKPLDFCAQM